MCEVLWNGFQKKEFEFERKKAILVFPEKKDAQGNWAIKTEYWDAFPAVEIALLKEGFYLAYLQNESRLAPVADCERKARFVKFLHETYGLREKCVPIGMSCGGAHAVNFAGYFPQCVQCMFIDAPVLNFCDFPANEDCKTIWETEFLATYPGMTRDKLLYFENHPINRVKTLIENRIPILMMYGTEDLTVNYNMNGKLLEYAYEGNEDLLTVIPREMQGHHPHGVDCTPNPVVQFILDRCSE